MTTRSRILWRVSPPIIRGAGRLFFSLEVSRQGDFPRGAFVIAANHYSHFDPPVIGAAVRKPMRFLALDDLFGVSPLLDWLVEGYGAIPTPRDRRPIAAVRTALRALHSGEVVAVFPEATRVSHWGTLPPKRGAAWLATRAQVPLVPVAVIGTGRAMDLENRIRRSPVTVVIGEPLEPDGDSNALTGRWADWITAQVQAFPDSEVDGPPRAYFSGDEDGAAPGHSSAE